MVRKKKQRKKAKKKGFLSKTLNMNARDIKKFNKTVEI